MDKEDESTVVADSFEGFQAMYLPLIEEHFKDVMEVRDGNFYIDREDRATQKRLLMHINDNIYKNLETYSVTLFDKKRPYTPEEKEQTVEKLMESDLDKQV